MSDSRSLIQFLRRVFHRHRWAYMGEAVARSTPHITYPVNQVCVGCHVLRFNQHAPGHPKRREPKPKFDGGQIHG